MNRACDARPTRRRAVVEAESTLGFRCVFDVTAPAVRGHTLVSVTQIP